MKRGTKIRMRYLCALWICVEVLFGSSTHAFVKRSSTEGAGFLVVAPDRGYLGNQEIETVFKEFSQRYQARLVFVCLFEEHEGEVRKELKAAMQQLRDTGAVRPVIIPLVFSTEDPHLKRTLRLLGLEGGPISPSSETEWVVAPPLSEDYRIAQILEDRARALSRDPARERFVVIGFGATLPEEEEALRSGLASLIKEVRARLPFTETEIVILYHGAADEEVWEKADQRARETLQEIASRTNLRNIVVPFHLGFKHTGSMQLSRRIRSMLAGLPLDYNGEEMLPHPNLLRWLQFTANRFSPPSSQEIGVVVMPHGAGHYHNARIIDAISPLQERYPLEIAFGMADTDTLEEAIWKLESRGIRRIHLLRLYDVSASLKEATEYVLGLRKDLGGHGHQDAPQRVRSSALFSTSGGFDDDPLISEVLLQRVLEVSREPEKETVILLAHGAGSDEKDAFWLATMQNQARFIKEKSGKPFREIRVATLREDWPEKREEALKEIRAMIQEAGKDGGRALVISDRIAGAGPYQKYLRGLDYVFNGTGIAPHPNLTRWVEREIEKWMGEVLHSSRPLADTGEESRNREGADAVRNGRMEAIQ